MPDFNYREYLKNNKLLKEINTMKKSELRQLIREEISNLQESSNNLKVGKSYEVLDLGINEWMEDLEYVGFDYDRKEHVFKGIYAPGSNDFQFYTVDEDEVDEMVR